MALYLSIYFNELYNSEASIRFQKCFCVINDISQADLPKPKSTSLASLGWMVGQMIGQGPIL